MSDSREMSGGEMLLGLLALGVCLAMLAKSKETELKTEPSTPPESDQDQEAGQEWDPWHNDGGDDGDD